jgi:hypothetical protein
MEIDNSKSRLNQQDKEVAERIMISFSSLSF